MGRPVNSKPIKMLTLYEPNQSAPMCRIILGNGVDDKMFISSLQTKYPEHKYEIEEIPVGYNTPEALYIIDNWGV